MEQNSDDKRLWEIARKRVAFKRHAIVYTLVNLALIVIWFLSWDRSAETTGLTYWFLYVLCGWGIGLAFHYWSAFHDDEKAVKKEFSKLKDMNSPEENQDNKTDNNSIPPVKRT